MATETTTQALENQTANQWQAATMAEVSPQDAMAQQMLGSINNGMFKVLRGVAGAVLKAKEGLNKWDKSLLEAKNKVDSGVQSLDRGVAIVDQGIRDVNNSMATTIGHTLDTIDSGIEGFNQGARSVNNSMADSVGNTLDQVDTFIDHVDAKIDKTKENAKDFIREVVNDTVITKNEISIELTSLKDDVVEGVADKVLKLSKLGVDFIADPIARVVQKGAEIAIKATPEAIRTGSNLLAAVEQTSADMKPKQAEALEKSSQFARRLEHGILAIVQYGMEGKRVPEKVRAVDANKRVEAVSKKLEKQGLGFMANAIRKINSAINNAEANATILREEAEVSKAKAESYLARANKWNALKEQVKVGALSAGVEALSQSMDNGINQLKTDRENRYEKQKQALIKNNPSLLQRWNRQFASV